MPLSATIKQKRYRQRQRKRTFFERDFHFSYFLKECRGLRADHDGTPLLASFFIDQYDELLEQGYAPDTIEELLQRLILLTMPLVPLLQHQPCTDQ